MSAPTMTTRLVLDRDQQADVRQGFVVTTADGAGMPVNVALLGVTVRELDFPTVHVLAADLDLIAAGGRLRVSAEGRPMVAWDLVGEVPA